jgi:hypothetical protein
MRKTRRRPLLASFVLAVVLMLMASPAAWAALLKAADWQMNETSGQMIDSSANGNNGTPTDVRRTGSTYVFNGSTSRVVVADNNSLDPAERDITLTARVLVNGGALDDDSYDVVRKGLAATAGGDYKMEIKGTSDPRVGQLHCLFKGSGGRVNRVARVDLQRGRNHGGSQNGESTRRYVRWLDGLREHRHRSIGRSVGSLLHLGGCSEWTTPIHPTA